MSAPGSTALTGAARPAPATLTRRPAFRLLVLGLLAVGLAGCTSPSESGSSTKPTALTADCQRVEAALTTIQQNAGKVSHTVWNTPVTQLSGSEASLRDQLLAQGVPGTDSMSGYYHATANGQWGKC
jgi:hypothetical protein